MRNQKHIPYFRWLCILVILGLTVLPFIFDVPVARADTQVGGPIISDTTWTLANSPYVVIASIDIQPGVTLTVEPGVTVKFNAGTKMQVNGGLISRGTISAPITFTRSITNGSWGGIEFTATAITTTLDTNGNYISGSILQYCTVEYGGATGSAGIYARSLLIDHCTIRGNFLHGVYALGTDNAPSYITNNVIVYSSGRGVYADRSVVRDNTIVQNGAGGIIARNNSTLQGNHIEGHYVSGAGLYGIGIDASTSIVMSNTVSNNSAIGVLVLGSSSAKGGGIGASDSTLIGNVVTDNTISCLEYQCGDIDGGGIHATRSMLVGNVVARNKVETARQDATGGGVYAFNSTLDTNIIIDNSIDCPSYNYNTCYGGGVAAYSNFGDFHIKHNYILGNAILSSPSRKVYGGGIFAAGPSSSLILTNTVIGNRISYGDGSGTYLSGDTSFLYNFVTGNTGALAGLGIKGMPDVHFNTFFGNTPYDVEVISSGDISGTNNYWGTISSVNILAQVYDWYDNSTRGKFLYIPYLQDPDPNAPIIPPTGLSATPHGNSVDLRWNAHPSFTTGWGYKVYYDLDSPYPPYQGSELSQGNSPIDVGNLTTLTLTGLAPDKDYYFAVTVYDNQGHESWYSNFVSDRYMVYLPLVRK